MRVILVTDDNGNREMCHNMCSLVNTLDCTFSVTPYDAALLRIGSMFRGVDYLEWRNDNGMAVYCTAVEVTGYICPNPVDAFMRILKEQYDWHQG